jgi:hypothetical protein
MTREDIFDLWPRPWRRRGDYVFASNDAEVCLIHCWRDLPEGRGSHVLADMLIDWSCEPEHVPAMHPGDIGA